MTSDPDNDPLARPLQRAVAVELRQVRQRLEALAEVLVADAHFIDNYLDQLQVFDWLGQCADEAADLISRAADGVPSAASVGAVRLGAMQQRLLEALPPAPGLPAPGGLPTAALPAAA